MTQTSDAPVPPVSSIDKALEILRLTSDGDDLAPRDLALLQTVVNEGVNALSEQGVKHWEGVYSDVLAGVYKKPWLHDIEHLTKDHEGYVRWKGRSVEHYTFSDALQEEDAAKKLAAGCMRLERDGIRVTSGALLDLWGRMRYAGELGVDLPRRAVSFDRGLVALNLQVHSLGQSSDAALKAEIDAIQVALNQPSGAGTVSVMPLITRQDFDVIVEAVQRSAEWSTSVVWRSGAMNSEHALHGEPAKSVALLERLVDRDGLVDESVVHETYLGASFVCAVPEADIHQREVFR